MYNRDNTVSLYATAIFFSLAFTHSVLKYLTLGVLFSPISLWWHHVTETPLDNKIMVFSKGILNGSKLWIPSGGHVEPSSIDGETLLWKNAQKNLKKNITSEIMNKAIPNFKPICTTSVWKPSLL